MILLIDNYDSFTYNIAHALAELGEEVRVVRNDAMTPTEAEALHPDYLVISPGPGRPEDAGLSIDLIGTLGRRLPVLGVCLGQQAIAFAFGATVGRAGQLVHGRASRVYHDGTGLFAGLPSPIKAGRYHSLAVTEESLPSCLFVTAQTTDGEIMGIRHCSLPVEGVQFHPESILTTHGKRIFQNFLGRKS